MISGLGILFSSSGRPGFQNPNGLGFNPLELDSTGNSRTPGLLLPPMGLLCSVFHEFGMPRQRITTDPPLLRWHLGARWLVLVTCYDRLGLRSLTVTQAPNGKAELSHYAHLSQFWITR